MHSQSARDVYYRFTLHYKKENLVAERNLGDFFITVVSGIAELSPDRIFTKKRRAADVQQLFFVRVSYRFSNLLRRFCKMY